jgi:hypothetical protein
MALAITHKEGDTEVLDLIRERKPPFSPEAVVEEFASTILKYRCSRCYGDHCGGDWRAEQFMKAGVHLEPSEKTKSDIYLTYSRSSTQRQCGYSTTSAGSVSRTI